MDIAKGIASNALENGGQSQPNWFNKWYFTLLSHSVAVLVGMLLESWRISPQINNMNLRLAAL